MNEEKLTIVGGTGIRSADMDFLQAMESTQESYMETNRLDPIRDWKIATHTQSGRETFIEAMCEDVDTGFLSSDLHLRDTPQKLRQLMENTLEEMTESQHIAMENTDNDMLPVVGLSIPVLKKNFLASVGKELMMTEVPNQPVIRLNFERTYLRTPDGKTKFYTPDIFYADKEARAQYREAMSYAMGMPVPDQFYPATPAGSLRIQDLDLLGESGGNPETDMFLNSNVTISQLKAIVGSEEIIIENVDKYVIAEPAQGGNISANIKFKDSAGTEYSESIYGKIDHKNGTVTVTSSGEYISQVKFTGNISNINNWRSLAFDRERYPILLQIPEGRRYNTPFQEERVRDYKALLQMNLVSKTVTEMAETMNQEEDNEILLFLEKSLRSWGREDIPNPYDYNNGFVEVFKFDMDFTSNLITPSQWAQEIRFNLNKMFERLKAKLYTDKIMFVLYGNPYNVAHITDGINWIVGKDNNSNSIAGVRLDYKYGVMTETATRVHVVSTNKVPVEEGLRALAFPTTEDHYTFKHYKYSVFVTNRYRNPNVTTVENLLGTSRYLTYEVLPVQGQMQLAGGDYGRVQLKDAVYPDLG